MKRVALSLLVLIGLVLIFNEPIKNIIVQELGRSAYHSKLAKPNKHRATFNFKQVKPLGTGSVGKAIVDYQGAIVKLSIPAVAMKIPIFYGLNNATLAKGGGTMKPDQVLGKGNYCIAGHYMTNRGNLFSPLKRVKLSDYIYLTDNQQVYTYRPVSNKIIDASEVAVINDVPGKQLVTLVTCGSAVEGTHQRIIVQGQLVKQARATAEALRPF